jgi:DNA-binding NtrC family response regulator
MQLARPVLSYVLGYDCDTLVDDVLVAAVQDAPLLLVGPNGAGQEHLVRAIHKASRRRHQGLLDVDELPPTREEQKRLLASAHRNTLPIRLAVAPLDQAFLDMAMSPAFHVRLLALAPSATAIRTMPPMVDGLIQMQRIEIRPLRQREHEFVRLIDHALFERRSPLRFSDLTGDNQQGLRAHDWPGNLDELSEVAARIAEIVREGSVRKAAQVLDTPRASLHYAMQRVGLTFPLARSGTSAEAEPQTRRARAGHDKRR